MKRKLSFLALCLTICAIVTVTMATHTKTAVFETPGPEGVVRVATNMGPEPMVAVFETPGPRGIVAYTG